MAKVVLNNVNSLQNETSALVIINGNSDKIEAAFENTLSRDGTSPNSMGAQLDMNSNRIINLPLPIQDSEPVRLSDLSSALFPADTAGNVIGPASAVAGNYPVFQGSSGKILADSSTNPTTITNAITNLGNLKANRAGDTFTGTINTTNVVNSATVQTLATKLNATAGGTKTKTLRADTDKFVVVNDANSAYLMSVTEAGQVQATSYTGDGTTLTGVETSTHASTTYSPITRVVRNYTSTVTLSAPDAGALIVMGNASTAAVNIPSDANFNFPVGTQIDFIKANSGTVVFSPQGGVSLGSVSSAKNLTQVNSSATLVKTNSNIWYVFGLLS